MSIVSDGNLAIARSAVEQLQTQGNERLVAATLVIGALAEFLESQNELKRKGYGVSGAGLLQMIREEVPDAAP